MMKRRVLCMGLLAGLLAAGPASAGIVVGFDQEGPSPVIQPGDKINIFIVADIPVGEEIVGFGMDVDIAPQPGLNFNGFTVNGLLFAAATGQDGDGIAGLAYPGAAVSGTVTLGSMSFVAKNPPEGDLVKYFLTLGDDNPGDLTEGFALWSGGFAAVTYGTGSVTVKPEPATLALLAFGALAMIRRRR